MRRSIVTATALALLLLAACGGGASKPDAAGNAVETGAIEAVKSYRFAPADIKVASGSTVTWRNSDNFVHDVHLLGAQEEKKPLPVGGSVTFTFNTPGLIRYECSLHPAQMRGSIQVT